VTLSVIGIAFTDHLRCPPLTTTGFVFVVGFEAQPGSHELIDCDEPPFDRLGARLVPREPKLLR
jgi:hypothetical protein